MHCKIACWNFRRVYWLLIISHSYDIAYFNQEHMQIYKSNENTTNAESELDWIRTEICTLFMVCTVWVSNSEYNFLRQMSINFSNHFLMLPMPFKCTHTANTHTIYTQTIDVKKMKLNAVKYPSIRQHAI